MNTCLDIKNYENLYKISNKGNVLSLRSNKILKTALSSEYNSVTLCKGGNQVTMRIHRLVCSAFY